MPKHLGLKILLGEYLLLEAGELLFQGRQWVLVGQHLRTCVIQTTYDSTVAGHPGREAMYTMVAC